MLPLEHSFSENSCREEKILTELQTLRFRVGVVESYHGIDIWHTPIHGNGTHTIQKRTL